MIILELPLTEKNNPKRLIALAVCPICGEDFNIVDGVARRVIYKGIPVRVMVCPNCEKKEGVDDILVEKIEKYANPEDLE